MPPIKCNNGHFYDAEKFARCPHCEPQGGYASDRTVFIDDDDAAAVPLAQGGGAAAAAAAAAAVPLAQGTGAGAVVPRANAAYLAGIASRCLKCFNTKGTVAVCPHCGRVDGTPPTEPFHLYPGTVLNGRYVIGTLIDSGGFGAVYRAWDSRLEIIVAIKEFYPSEFVGRLPGVTQVSVFSAGKREDYKAALTRFLDEARNLAKFSAHPNILNVHEFFEENGTAYIVMEYLQGMSLGNYLKKKGGESDTKRFNQGGTLNIALPVMDALSAIHATGIVHRDMHPGNIFILNPYADPKRLTVEQILDSDKLNPEQILDPDKLNPYQIKILDFGTAKFATGKEERTKAITVTHGYAAPEQYLRTRKQGPPTDIYGLGATVYKMLTGAVPEESLERQVKDSLKSPSKLGISLDESLDKAVMKALSPNYDLRFKRVEEFRDEIEHLVGTAERLPENKHKKGKNKKIVLAGALAAGLCAAVALTAFLIDQNKTLDNIAIAAETVSVWLPVSGDETQRDARIGAYEKIKDSFESEYEQIKIDIVPVDEADYNEQLVDAFVYEGRMPTLFSTDRFEGDVSKIAAPLDMLLRSVDADELLFISDYRGFYPSGRELPLGFRIATLYANIDNKAGLAIPDEVTTWEQLCGETPSVAFGADCVSETLELYSGPLISAGELDIDSNTIGKILQMRETEKALSKTAQTLFAEGEPAYLVESASALRSIRNALQGRYKVVPLSNEDGTMAGAFADMWAVSQSAASNEQHAAMLFLRYMLNADSQDTLYLQNNGAIPLNKAVFEKYIYVTSDFAFLPDRIGDLWLAGEDGRILNRFAADVYENVMRSDADEARLREYLENYADSVRAGRSDGLLASLTAGADNRDESEGEGIAEEKAEGAAAEGSTGEVSPSPKSQEQTRPGSTVSAAGPKPTAPPAAESIVISLDASSIVLGIGESRQLSAAVTPSGTVAWSSQNSAVASVGRTGIVTGMGPGTTTVTAACEGKSVSCKVSVQ
jgi:serine/threonine protein kinase